MQHFAVQYEQPFRWSVRFASTYSNRPSEEESCSARFQRGVNGIRSAEANVGRPECASSSRLLGAPHDPPSRRRRLRRSGKWTDARSRHVVVHMWKKCDCSDSCACACTIRPVDMETLSSERHNGGDTILKHSIIIHREKKNLNKKRTVSI